MAAHDTLCPMAKGKKERGVPARLAALLASGDHRAARAEAMALRADATAPEADQVAAAEVLASLRPEPAAVLVGLLAAAAALLITARVLLG
jgi:hypothetical protein